MNPSNANLFALSTGAGELAVFELTRQVVSITDEIFSVLTHYRFYPEFPFSCLGLRYP